MAYEIRHHVIREIILGRYETGMLAKSTSTAAVPEKLVDPRTRINMTKLLARLEEQRKARRKLPVVALRAPSMRPRAVVLAPPPVLRPIFTTAQLVILADIEATLASF